MRTYVPTSTTKIAIKFCHLATLAQLQRLTCSSSQTLVEVERRHLSLERVQRPSDHLPGACAKVAVPKPLVGGQAVRPADQARQEVDHDFFFVRLVHLHAQILSQTVSKLYLFIWRED